MPSTYSVKDVKRCECGAEIVVLVRRGPRDKCRKCAQRVRIERWKAANPERKAELNKLSDARDPERVKARQKRWIEKDPDHVRALARARTARYYQRKKDEGR